MWIDVIGGGALGLLYGARLAEAGAKVTIWTRSKGQAEQLRSDGISFIPANGREARSVVVRAEWIEQASEIGNKQQSAQGVAASQWHNGHWVLLTVKQPALTGKLLKQTALIAGRGGKGAARASILCMQNGIGHMERIIEALPDYDVYAAVTSEGARRHDECTVEHTGLGEVWLGPFAENGRKPDEISENMLKMFVSSMKSAGIDLFVSNEMVSRIYSKLLINAVINPLTALFQIRNGELPADPLRLKLMKALYAETERILLSAGMTPLDGGFERVLKVCELTSGNISSMLSDVQSAAVTEIAYINGAVAAMALKRGGNAPLNEAVTAIITALHPITDKED